MATLASAYIQIVPSAEGIQSGTIDALSQSLGAADSSTRQWEQSLNSIANIMRANFVGGVISGVVSGIKSIASAMTGAVQGAFQMSTAAGQFADNLVTLSQQTHVSAQSLQEWSYASRFIDTSVEAITGSMTKLTRNMSSSSAETAAAMRKLHVSMKENGQLRETEAVFWDIIDALGKIPNETQRDQLAMQLLGRSAQELNPLIQAGSAAFKGMASEAQQMGSVIGEDLIAKMGEFDDSMQRLDAASSSLKTVIGAQLAPAFQPLIDAASNAAGALSRLLQDGLQAEDVGSIAETLKQNFSGAFENIGSMVQEVLPVILDVLREVFTEVAQFCQTELPGILQEIGSFLSDVGSVIGPALMPVGAAIVEALGSVLSSALSSVDWGSIMLSAAEAIVAGLVMLVGAIAIKLGELLAELWDALGQAIADGVSSMLESVKGQADEFVAAGREWMNGIMDGVSSGIENVIGAVMEIPNRIMSAISGAVSEMVRAGQELVNGLIQGIQQKAQQIADAILGPVRSAVNSVKGFLGIQSPSKLMNREIGRQMVAGMAQGISEGGGLVESALSDVTGDAVDAARAGARVMSAGRANARADSAAAPDRGGITQNLTVNSPRELSPYEVARQSRNTLRGMVLSMTAGG